MASRAPRWAVPSHPGSRPPRPSRLIVPPAGDGLAIGVGDTVTVSDQATIELFVPRWASTLHAVPSHPGTAQPPPSRVLGLPPVAELALTPADTVVVSDEATFDVALTAEDSVAAADEATVASEQAVGDTVDATDTTTLAFELVVGDSVTVADLNLISETNDVALFFDDAVTVTDIAAIVVTHPHGPPGGGGGIIDSRLIRPRPARPRRPAPALEHTLRITDTVTVRDTVTVDRLVDPVADDDEAALLVLLA